MSRNETEKLFFVVSFISSSLEYINGIEFAQFGLLIDRRSSIYLDVRLQALDSQSHENVEKRPFFIKVCILLWKVHTEIIRVSRCNILEIGKYEGRGDCSFC